MMTDEFKAQYPKYYGRAYAPITPDFNRCAGRVGSAGSFGGSCQCSRKHGHGPQGAWCKTHDPVAREEKRMTRLAAERAKWARDAAIRALRSERDDIIRKIAEGHDNPRELCADWLKRWRDV